VQRLPIVFRRRDRCRFWFGVAVVFGLAMRFGVAQEADLQLSNPPLQQTMLRGAAERQ
jgi:hypothetical protein